jgi:hypothetical protein
VRDERLEEDRCRVCRGSSLEGLEALGNVAVDRREGMAAAKGDGDPSPYYLPQRVSTTPL